MTTPLISFDDTGESQIGAGFSAGCRLLQARYRLSPEVALLTAAAAIATACGPSPRIRDPLGPDLPLSLEISFIAGSDSLAPSAVTDAFRFFLLIVGDKLLWKENAGSRRLRAEFLDLLLALEGIEQALRAVPPAAAPKTRRRPPSKPVVPLRRRRGPFRLRKVKPRTAALTNSSNLKNI